MIQATQVHNELRKAWLEPMDYLDDFSELNRHIASRAPGTGIWVCDTPPYQQWHNTDDHGSIWVKGAPGAGKSVISACLVQHLKATEKSPVLSFCFRHNIGSNRRSRNLVALNAIVDIKLEDFSGGQLWDYTLLGLSSVKKTYCAVDALDEVDIVEEKDLLQRLNNLATFRLHYVKIPMTSRPVQQLQLRLKDTSIIHISLEDDRAGKDINLFIFECLRNIFERRNPDLELTLHSIILDGSAGVFSCNRGRDECCCDWSIATLYNIGFLKVKLDHPFLDYAIRNRTYHRNHYDNEQKSVFDAVSAFSNPKSTDFRRWLTLDWGIRFITKDSVVPSPAHVAPPSGMIDNEDDSHPRTIHAAARRDSAPIVLALLKAGVNPTRSTDDNSRPDSEVCARNREAESGTALDYRRPGVITAMFNQWKIESKRWSDDNLVHAREQILNLLLKYGANLEAKDSNGRTPLWLCFTSRTTVAKLGIRCFLNAGSNATMKDEKGHGAIYNVLARTKDVELLKLLIHHGADVSPISKDGESYLEALFAYRFTTRDTDSFDTTIRFLVKNGARCDVQPVKRLSIIERVANSKDYSIETFKILL
ncbi:hypothetical protein BOTNAR_0240g00150 [Botryotinia narcissicola]|uniref:Nephrocystin 3-like N-terminal domain-containing protein n=1 Tax=Botryotinia narcissicola TaxID=278944 RepID=A0A4Z1I1W6_9HELO|nr:hypothetical protein BOTNAR_0240g00150 [Botryotinia narcissicola]